MTPGAFKYYTGTCMKERPLVFMKHLAQGSRGPAGMQREETHLADAVMGSGVEV